jgi:mono/diheme cytochrome c family protein
MGRELVPKPRSFRTGLFKYRSTPPGKLPTDADLENTIRHGVPDTSMPIFDKLSQSDVRAVIEYLKFFSKRWSDPANYAPPMRVPETPAWISDPVRRSQAAELGRSLYQDACASCHGVAGLGDGPAAVTLVDGWNEPIRPANLRHGNARAGATPEALHRVLLTGIEGTPMPDYAEAMSEEQRWAVIAHLLELRAGSASEGAR